MHLRPPRRSVARVKRRTVPATPSPAVLPVVKSETILGVAQENTRSPTEAAGAVGDVGRIPSGVKTAAPPVVHAQVSAGALRQPRPQVGVDEVPQPRPGVSVIDGQLGPLSTAPEGPRRPQAQRTLGVNAGVQASTTPFDALNGHLRAVTAPPPLPDAAR